MEKDIFWSEIGQIRIWRTGRFTPTKNNQEYPSPGRQMQKCAKNVPEIFQFEMMYTTIDKELLWNIYNKS